MEEATICPTDAELLARFVKDRDEQALEEIIQRHGRLMMGVCKRLLPNQHDAEDAFQATLIVLAQKAPSLVKCQSVAGWLHGVALRIGLKARTTFARRRKHEKEAAMAQAEDTKSVWQELSPHLDEELCRLPDKYRLPLVLCYMEGKTYAAAGQELKLTDGMLRARLTKGRELLKKRLSRLGMVVPVALLTSLLQEHALAASLPPAYVKASISAATMAAASPAAMPGGVSSEVAELARAGLDSLWWSSFKTAAATVLLTAGMTSACVAVMWPTRVAEKTSTAQPGFVVTGPLSSSPSPTPHPGTETGPLEHTLPKTPRNLPARHRPGRAKQKPDDTAILESDVVVPDDLRAMLSRHYAGGRILELEQEHGQDLYEVEIRHRGMEVELTVSHDLEILAIEQEIAPNDLPDRILSLLDKEYTDALFAETEKRLKDGKTTYYIKLQQEEQRIQLSLSPNGKVLKRRVKPARKKTSEHGEEDGRTIDIDQADGEAF